MTLPPDAVSQARVWFSEMRKLTQYRSPTDRVCDAEEAMIALLEREMRAPTGLASPDGFPAGGGGIRGGSTSTTTEAAALMYEPDENGKPVRVDQDLVGPAVLGAYDFLEQAGRSAKTVTSKITEASKLSSRRLSLGRTAAVCCEEGCEELAVTTEESRYPGRCENDRRWLDREYNRAVSEGRDPVRCVPRSVIEARKNPPKRHDHEPADDVVSRLVAGYQETA